MRSPARFAHHIAYLICYLLRTNATYVFCLNRALNRIVEATKTCCFCFLPLLKQQCLLSDPYEQSRTWPGAPLHSPRHPTFEDFHRSQMKVHHRRFDFTEGLLAVQNDGHCRPSHNFASYRLQFCRDSRMTIELTA